MSRGQLHVMTAREAAEKPGPGGESSLAAVLRRVEARKAWEAAHDVEPLCPCHGLTLAKAWAEALAEEDFRSRVREREAAEAGFRARAPDMLKRIGVPLDAIDALKVPTDTPPIASAKRFMAADTSEVRFLVLLGRPGTGKTVAAAWCLREALARFPWCSRPSGGEAREPQPAMFTRASTFARMSAYAEADKAWLAELTKTGLLVLDDVGAEPLSDVARALLDELLDTRHSARLRTVLTSNLPGKPSKPGEETFRMRIGERLADRILPASITAVCTGESMRRRVRP